MEYPNWFEMTAKENFEQFLPEHLGPDSKSLQLGVFTGDASLWLMMFTATDLTDVDTWAGDSEDIDGFDWDDVYKTYQNKLTSYWDHRVHPDKAPTQDFLKDVKVIESFRYDFIYIDADHTAKGTLEDAVNSFPLLKVGGIMAFDDYTWRHELGMLHEPWMAIDMFAAIYRDKFQTLAKNSQYWVRKVGE